MPSRNHSPFARQKPPAGSQIDWGHPLTRGLIELFAGLENGGINSFGLVGGRPAQVVITNSAWRGHNLFKYVWYKAIAAPSRIPVAFDPRMNPLTSFSFFTWTQGISGNTPCGIFAIDNAFSTHTWNLQLSAPTNGVVQWQENGVATVNGSTNVVAGTMNLIGFTKDGTTLTIYLNGKADGVATVNGTLAYTPTNGSIFGASGGSNNYEGLYGPSYYYGRALHPTEVQQIYNEPFAMLRGPGRSSVKVAA